MEEEKVLCVDCMKEIDLDESTFFDGEHHCEECMDNYSFCDECETYHSQDDVTFVESEEIGVCRRCLRLNFTSCDCCGDYTRDCDLINCGDDGEICELCYENEYFRCDSCDEIFHNDERNSDGYDYYCSSCYSDMDMGSIYEFDYKPNATFFGSSVERLYLGVELEVDNGRDRENVASQLKGCEEIYCKSDGSLDYGVEVVTHPCTLDYHLNNIGWENIISVAKSNGFKSHDAGSCGLHVHLSKKAFGSNSDEIENNIAKMIILTEKNWEQILKFSRRTQSQMNEWSRRYLTDSNVNNTNDIEYVKGVVRDNSTRYRTINVQNTDTVEIRFFRGTLIEETLKASLEFSVAMLQIAKNNSLKDILNKELVDFVDVFNEYQYITPYMEKRGIL